VFALNAHASYACRHSGACCTAGWTIPVEPHARALLQVDWLTPDDSGGCPQYDRSSARCRVHRDHGEATLPRSCHHFPRRALIDRRGTFVTLSHFCPTAASLLIDFDGPLDIVEGPQAFPPGREYDGLDARGEWLPLLRERVLFDAESYSAWERYLVRSIASFDGDTTSALNQVACDADRLRAWRAADMPLIDWTMAVVDTRQGHGRPTVTDVRAAAAHYAPYGGTVAYRHVCRCIQPGLPGPTLTDDIDDADHAWVAPVWPSLAPFARRYVAAKAFGSWTAYQSRGVRAQIAELHVVASVLRVECARAVQRMQRPLDRDVLMEAIRASDLLLMHLSDRDALVDWLRKADIDDAPAKR
jgi:hypothetical protein